MYSIAKTISIFFAFVGLSINASAQWSLSGQNIYYSTGNVGIGTNSPQGSLEIVGESTILRLRGSSYTLKTPLDVVNLGFQGVTGAFNVTFRIGFPYANGVNDGPKLDWLKLLNGNTILSTSESNSALGNVGIGTTTPAEALQVSGNIRIGSNEPSSAGSYQINMPGGSATINNGNGRDLFIAAGSSDNQASAIGGRLFLRPGVPSAPSNNFGSVLIADNGGLVGIGTGTPRWPLDVNGQIAARGQAVLDASSTEISVGDLAGGDGYRDVLSFYTHDAKRMTIDGSGNVGIGTTSPDAKLAVKGTIHTQEVKVDLLGSMVPDYVFESNYQLRPLESVKTFIDQNKHLPEVPSAKEMETNGMNVGEMNLLLLKKIEELTLYVIELKKELEIVKQNQKD